MANIKSIGGNPIVLDASGIAAGAVTPDKLADMDGITAGAALGITGEATDSAAWLQRVSTSDGPTTAKSIHGRTLRWNQLVSDSDTSVTVPSGHKYVARIDGTTTLATSDGTAITVTGGTDNVLDLTTMFGAGNEPATVAEFEELFPKPYYEYDAGSLLPVQMEGIETVGFNQWDEEWELGSINHATGATISDTRFIRSKNFIDVFPSTEYCYTNGKGTAGRVFFYDIDGVYISRIDPVSGGTFTTPANCRKMKMRPDLDYGTTYNHDICINISDPSRNGTYEPYWRSERAIPAIAENFPDGMRGVGTGDNMVCDELTNHEAIRRVGEVDLGTLTWTANSTSISGVYRMYSTGLASLAVHPSSNAVAGNLVCGKYETLPFDCSTSVYAASTGIAITSGGNVSVYDPAYNDADSAAAFKTAMSGVMLHYALATPTTQPIDPPLNMTYRTAQGGTERVMVPTGENSAPPTIVAAQGYTAESLRDAALSAIAPVENGKASTNYAVGSYLVHGGQLCKVTTAIATGEAIAIGTNVTATTVMAEVIALIAQ